VGEIEFPAGYLDLCPVCEQGSCRVRCARSADGALVALVVCDECEAIWQQPNLQGEPYYSDPAEPRCPTTGWPLWDPDRWHWAAPQEMEELGWRRSEPAVSSPGVLPEDMSADQERTSHLVNAPEPPATDV